MAAMFTNGAQQLGFASLQPFSIYTWQAYVCPGDGPWPTPGAPQVAAPLTMSNRGIFMLNV